jgi:hypothetical protein
MDSKSSEFKSLLGKTTSDMETEVVEGEASWGSQHMLVVEPKGITSSPSYTSSGGKMTLVFLSTKGGS